MKLYYIIPLNTAQKMKFSIKDLFSKCDQIRSFLRIWSHLLSKSLMENFIFGQWNDLTGHTENFKMKLYYLYYFQERLSLWYNIILKLLSPFLYVSSEIINSQNDLFFKEQSWSRMILYFMFYIINQSVYDHSTSLTEIKSKHVFDDIFTKTFF